MQSDEELEHVVKGLAEQAAELLTCISRHGPGRGGPDGQRQVCLQGLQLLWELVAQ